jgi:hypothetical protein
MSPGDSQPTSEQSGAVESSDADQQIMAVVTKLGMTDGTTTEEDAAALQAAKEAQLAKARGG